MSRLLVLASAASLIVVLAGPAAAPAQPVRPAKAEEELVDRVRKSIDSGVKFLKNQQNPKTGNWEGVVVSLLADMEGGQTALVTLALLNCGVPANDPKVARALEYLEKLPPKKTYVVGLQNLVFAETREKKYLPLIQKNADWLIDQALGFRRGDGQLEGWSYPGNTIADNSNTQYALLGLFAAKQAGARIDDKVWKGILDYYARTQLPRGPAAEFWAYYNGALDNKPSISMSVAGVCGLLIASMGLDQSEQGLDPKTGVAANCGVYDKDSALARGMNWVGAHFTFQSPKSTFYNFYGIERLGRVSGQRFIGRVDWYREGCEQLVGKYDPGARVWRGGMQREDGSFVSDSKSVDGHPLLATSFALLFLSKGRTPVLISKLAWGDFQDRGGGTFVEVPNRGDRPGTVNWNRKHHDTRHVVEFCARELFNNAPLAWQVYDPRRRTLETEDAIREEVGSLLQSPVLYLNGHGRIPFLTEPTAGDVGLSATEKILKLYLEEGGFLVAEACCGDPVFAADFRRLMRRLFENNTLAPLPPEHPIRTIIPGLTPADFPELEYLDRGCRTVALFSPVPLAGFWEESKYMPADAKHPQNRGEKAFCLARNVVAYATGMELPKPKLTRTNLVKGTEQGLTRSHFKPVQFRIGDTPPAPDALKNLMGFLRDNARLEVALNTAVLPPGDDQLFAFKFMYLHGRRPLDLSEGEIENIQGNLQSGGLLFADAACNGYQQWKDFDKSFREMCKRMFPDQPLVEIRETTADGKEDPLFRIAREAGINIKSVKCRRELPDNKGPEPGEPRSHPLLLEGIKIDGRWVVIYSKYDIGCAIEGHKAADCLGHDKDSALRIASAVVLYSLKR
jgi:hypothetical protein